MSLTTLERKNNEAVIAALEKERSLLEKYFLSYGTFEAALKDLQDRILEIKRENAAI